MNSQKTWDLLIETTRLVVVAPDERTAERTTEAADEDEEASDMARIVIGNR